MTIYTPRMTLIPATAELITLETTDPDALERQLNAAVPANWPPELIRDALPWFRSELAAAPPKSGWFCWYGVAREEDSGRPILAASGGFMGPPTNESVEIGYSILPQFQGRGYATKMMAALIEWAGKQSPVSTLAAEALPDNRASLRVLAKLGFVPWGTANEPGHVRLKRRRA